MSLPIFLAAEMPNCRLQALFRRFALAAICFLSAPAFSADAPLQGEVLVQELLANIESHPDPTPTDIEAFVNLFRMDSEYNCIQQWTTHSPRLPGVLYARKGYTRLLQRALELRRYAYATELIFEAKNGQYFRTYVHNEISPLLHSVFTDLHAAKDRTAIRKYLDGLASRLPQSLKPIDNEHPQ